MRPLFVSFWEELHKLALAEISLEIEIAYVREREQSEPDILDLQHETTASVVWYCSNIKSAKALDRQVLSFGHICRPTATVVQSRRRRF